MRSRLVQVLLIVAGFAVVGGTLVAVTAPLVSIGSTPSPSPTVVAPPPIAPTPLPTTNEFGDSAADDPVDDEGGTIVPMPGGPADPYPDYIPDSCPEGTTAGRVDAYGNESNCQPDAPAGG